MDNDDRTVGHVLSRRETLALFGTAGAALLVACAPKELIEATSAASEPSSIVGALTTNGTAAAQSTATVPMPACVVRPELTEVHPSWTRS
jgi:hypothetical protein